MKLIYKDFCCSLHIMVLQYLGIPMKKSDRFKKKWINYKYDHIKFFNGLDFTRSALYVIAAAFIYAFAFYCFITPAVVNHATVEGSSIITGGVGGITQTLTLAFELAGIPADPYLFQSIGYFAFNVPILIFAYFKVGKKFAILSVINVGMSSAFIQVLNQWDLAKQVALAISNEHLARVLFGGVLVGISSALAYRASASAGGIDVFSYYFALRKSTNVGKYSASINSSIVFLYTILTIAINKGALVQVALLGFMYSIVYLLVNMLVVDFINTRNKKVQLQIITNREDMSYILISNFPHSTTIVNAKGGYSGQEKKIIYMTVSSSEVKKVVYIVRKVDEHSFISVTSLVQAYGNFFIKPIE